MSDVVRQLYELQELDLRVVGVEKSLAEHVAKLADKSLLNAARAKLAGLERRLDGLSSERRSLERTVSEAADSLSALEKRLYGGGITNAQQMAAAEDERTFTITRQGEFEDHLLELMMAMDDLEPLVDSAKQALSRLEEARPGQEVEWQEASASLRDELAVMALEREEVLPLVAANLLPMYELLRRTKGGRAVARVERNLCEGCRLSLPTGDVQKARASLGTVLCSSCGRILYAE
ncbi:MAG: C4-type zinc ribbon domain-containing protein [SAR202 cluster bacterium]|nr:C4-type zinc ribbon domain-containing protein [SAR202 cluster bacterium]